MSSRFLFCPACGRIVEEHVTGRGPLICCGSSMVELIPNSLGSPEDHAPRVYPEEDGMSIEVGLVPHEMREESRILWLEIIKDGSRHVREYLRFTKRPEASFSKLNTPFKVRILCSKHGLWEFSHEPVRLEVSEAVSKAIERYNSLRGRESLASIVDINEKLIKVEFSGNFCRTCGFYDYFEDFRQLLEELGLKSKIGSIEETEEGAFVTYAIEGD